MPFRDVLTQVVHGSSIAQWREQQTMALRDSHDDAFGILCQEISPELSVPMVESAYHRSFFSAIQNFADLSKIGIQSTSKNFHREGARSAREP